MRIQELRSLTIYELNRRMTGWQKGDDRLSRKLRRAVRVIIGPHVKRVPRERDIWPLPTDGPRPKMDPEDIKADVERKKRAFFNARRN